MLYPKSIRILVLSLTVLPFAFVAPAFAQGPRHDGHDQSRHQGRTRRYSRSTAAYTVPDVMLLDMRGERVRLASLLEADAPVILQFIFTTCTTICPAMSGTFAEAQNRYGSELAGARLISISIDPEVDTPPRLREYASKFKAGPRWMFLTGSLDDILAVQKAFDAYRGNKMRHEPATYMRAARGRIWVRLGGLTSAKSLVEEYEGMLSR